MDPESRTNERTNDLGQSDKGSNKESRVGLRVRQVRYGRGGYHLTYSRRLE